MLDCTTSSLSPVPPHPYKQRTNALDNSSAVHFFLVFISFPVSLGTKNEQPDPVAHSIKCTCQPTAKFFARAGLSTAILLRKMGLEPTRHCCHKILSLARLPVPTLPHAVPGFTPRQQKVLYHQNYLSSTLFHAAPIFFQLLWRSPKPEGKSVPQSRSVGRSAFIPPGARSPDRSWPLSWKEAGH